MLSTETNISVADDIGSNSASHCHQMLLWVLEMCWMCGSLVLLPVGQISVRFLLSGSGSIWPKCWMALGIAARYYRPTVSITALKHECHKVWLVPNHL